MSAALGLQVLCGLLTTSQPHLKGPQHLCAKQDICKVYYIFQLRIWWKIPTSPPKKTWHMTIWENILMQRSSIWHVLASMLWCFKFKEGGWMAKAGSFKPRLVSWFKLWKKCIMLVQFTTSFTTCHGVSFSFLVYMDDSLVSWTSFPDQLSVCVPKQDPPVICFNRQLRANVSIVRPTVETKIDPKKKPWWIHILWANM